MSASPRFPDLPKHWNETKGFVIKGEVHYRLWKTHSPQTGKHLVVVHGFGENSNRYRHFPFYLDGIVDSILAIDLMGHGLSKGRRGDCNRFSEYTDRVIIAAQELLASVTGSVHWFGHSFGGLITLSLLKQEKLKAMTSIMVSAPMLGLAFPPPPVKKFFGELIEPILGHLSLKNEIDGAILSHDVTVPEAYAKDPLNHDRITPRTFVQMTKAMKMIRGWEGPIDKPLLVLLPLEDQLIDAKATMNFFSALKTAGTGKKQLQTFPGFFHESFNETHKGIAFNALANWLLSY